MQIIELKQIGAYWSLVCFYKMKLWLVHIGEFAQIDALIQIGMLVQIYMFVHIGVFMQIGAFGKISPLWQIVVSVQIKQIGELVQILCWCKLLVQIGLLGLNCYIGTNWFEPHKGILNIIFGSFSPFLGILGQYSA